MKDFSKLSEWVSNQSLEKTGEVIQAAVNRGSTINSIITGLPQRYNSVFQSVFMYHYDSDQQLVDDTTKEAQAVADSVIDQAKADLAGYKKYFEDTKSGITIDGEASLKTEWLDLDFGLVSINVDKDSGEFQSAVLKSPVSLSLKFDTPPNGFKSNISIRELSLGCGYTLQVIVHLNGSVEYSGGPTQYSWTIENAQCELSKNGVAIAHTAGFQSVSGESATYTTTIPGQDFLSGPSTLEKKTTNGESKVTSSDTMGITYQGYSNSPYIGPYIAEYGFSDITTKNIPTSSEIEIQNGVDIIQKIYTFFLDIDEAMKMMP